MPFNLKSVCQNLHYINYFKRVWKGYLITYTQRHVREKIWQKTIRLKYQVKHCIRIMAISSVQFSLSVLSDSEFPWTAAHSFPVHHQVPKLTQNSCPSSRWCHPTTSSSVIPFSSCPQSFQASGSFPMSQSEWLLSKSLQTINAGEGVEKREPSYTVGETAN